MARRDPQQLDVDEVRWGAWDAGVSRSGAGDRAPFGAQKKSNLGTLARDGGATTRSLEESYSSVTKRVAVAPRFDQDLVRQAIAANNRGSTS